MNTSADCSLPPADDVGLLGDRKTLKYRIKPILLDVGYNGACGFKRGYRVESLEQLCSVCVGHSRESVTDGGCGPVGPLQMLGVVPRRRHCLIVA